MGRVLKEPHFGSTSGAPRPFASGVGLYRTERFADRAHRGRMAGLFEPGHLAGGSRARDSFAGASRAAYALEASRRKEWLEENARSSFAALPRILPPKNTTKVEDRPFTQGLSCKIETCVMSLASGF